MHVNVKFETHPLVHNAIIIARSLLNKQEKVKQRLFYRDGLL